MNPMFRKTLLAGAIATLVASPVWAQSQTDTQAAPGTTTTPMERAPDASPATPATPASPATPSASSQSTSPLYSMTPDQLKGMDVVDASGEKIGSVKAVVHARGQEKIEAVISSGGVLGMGAKQVAVSLDELQLMDDKLQIAATQQELEARGEYVKEQYVELKPEDQPISEFSAFESTPQEPGAAGSAADKPMTSPPASGEPTYKAPPAPGSGESR